MWNSSAILVERKAAGCGIAELGGFELTLAQAIILTTEARFATTRARRLGSKMRPRVALVCTVWGAEFCDFFCQYSLATLLSPTNLPRAGDNHDLTLLLYTTKQDLGRIEAHPNFRKA